MGRLRWRWIAAIIVLAIAVPGGYRLWLEYTDNFHEIVPGEMFRSAQPTPERLAEWRKTYGIKTVLNLRGAKPGKDWYDTELAATGALGLTHIDYQLSADVVVSADQIRDLKAILAEAEKPILIHCKEGADRAGLVSALYLATVSHRSEAEAAGQLSFYYGHVSIPLAPSYAMDESWDAAKAGLVAPGQ